MKIWSVHPSEQRRKSPMFTLAAPNSLSALIPILALGSRSKGLPPL